MGVGGFEVRVWGFVGIQGFRALGVSKKEKARALFIALASAFSKASASLLMGCPDS